MENSINSENFRSTKWVIPATIYSIKACSGRELKQLEARLTKALKLIADWKALMYPNGWGAFDE